MKYATRRKNKKSYLSLPPILPEILMQSIESLKMWNNFCPAMYTIILCCSCTFLNILGVNLVRENSLIFCTCSFTKTAFCTSVYTACLHIWIQIFKICSLLFHLHLCKIYNTHLLICNDSMCILPLQHSWFLIRYILNQMMVVYDPINECHSVVKFNGDKCFCC